MYLFSPGNVACRKQSTPTRPTTTTQMPTQQESRTKRVKKKKTTKHGRRRRVTEEQHPYDKSVKMRSKMQKADIERKTLNRNLPIFFKKSYPTTMRIPNRRWQRHHHHHQYHLKAQTHRKILSQRPLYPPLVPPSCHATAKAYSHPL